MQYLIKWKKSIHEVNSSNTQYLTSKKNWCNCLTLKNLGYWLTLKLISNLLVCLNITSLISSIRQQHFYIEGLKMDSQRNSFIDYVTIRGQRLFLCWVNLDKCSEGLHLSVGPQLIHFNQIKVYFCFSLTREPSTSNTNTIT